MRLSFSKKFSFSEKEVCRGLIIEYNMIDLNDEAWRIVMPTDFMNYDGLVEAIPAYKKIYYELKKDIISCKFSPNSKLPSENKLKALYGVSRFTIQHALQLLVQDGLVIKKQGQASFVRPINDTEKEHKVLHLGCLNQPEVLLTDYCFVFAKRVRELTAGKVDVEIHHSSSLGTGSEQIQNVLSGKQDMFCAAVEWLADIDSAWGIVSYPFMFSNIEHLKKMLNHPYVPIMRESLVKSYGVRVITANWYRPSRLLVSQKPCLHEEDIKGMRIGIPAIKLYHTIWSSFGAIPIEVSFGERKKAFQEGYIDATDVNWDIILSEKLYADVKYATLTNHSYSRASIIMNEEKFQSFIPDIRTAIEQAARETGDLYSQHLFNSFAEDKKILMDYKMCFIEANFSTWHKIANEQIKKTLTSNGHGMSLYNCIKDCEI